MLDNKPETLRYAKNPPPRDDGPPVVSLPPKEIALRLALTLVLIVVMLLLAGSAPPLAKPFSKFPVSPVSPTTAPAKPATTAPAAVSPTPLFQPVRRLTSPKIIPWVECNGGSASEIDACVQALLPWDRLTDTVIVSTVPGKSAIYMTLSQRLGMTVIPGIKTEPILQGDLASENGWGMIAEQVKLILANTGGNTFVFENETALNSYLEGTNTVDLSRLRISLALLPKANYVWYPGITYATPGLKRERALALNAVVGGVLNCSFTDHMYGHPQWPAFKDWVSAHEALQRLTLTPNTPIVWTYCCDGFCYWQPNQARYIIGMLAGFQNVIVYPGASRSAETARTFYSALWPDK